MPALAQAHYEALADFRHAVARFLAFSARAARTVGLEPQQHQVLLAVKGWRGPAPLTITVLAERLQLRHNSVVGLIDRLARRGLLRRVPDPTDHRRARVALTPAGSRVIARLAAAHLAELRQLGPELQARLANVARLGHSPGR